MANKFDPKTGLWTWTTDQPTTGQVPGAIYGGKGYVEGAMDLSTPRPIAPTSGNQYDYIDTSGRLQFVNAASANEALKNAQNLATHSGVQLQKPVGEIYGTNGTIKTGTDLIGSGSPVRMNATEIAERAAADELQKMLEGRENFAINETEEQERARILRDFQDQIDALNQVYATNRAEATRLGQGRLGTDTAIQARRGLIGSSFGEAMTTGQEQFNVQEMNKVEAEYNKSMNVIHGQLRDSLDKARTQKREDINKSKENRVKKLQIENEINNKVAKDQVKLYIALKNQKGLTVSDEDLEKDAAEIGINPGVMKEMYRTALIAENEKATSLQQAADKSAADLNKLTSEGGYMIQNGRIVGNARSVNEGGTSSTGTLDSLDIQRYNEMYPGAGLVPGDTITTANAKIESLKDPITKALNDAKSAGDTYESIIAEINADDTIEDKQSVIDKANKVYGKESTNSISGTSGNLNVNETAPSGTFSNTPIAERYTQLKDIFKGNPHFIKGQLIKDGYTTSQANKIVNENGDIINQISTLLFGNE